MAYKKEPDKGSRHRWTPSGHREMARRQSIIQVLSPKRFDERKATDHTANGRKEQWRYNRRLAIPGGRCDQHPGVGTTAHHRLDEAREWRVSGVVSPPAVGEASLSSAALPSWHKTRALSPPCSATRTPANANSRCGLWQGVLCHDDLPSLSARIAW